MIFLNKREGVAMSYADSKLTADDHQLITVEIARLTSEFGVREREGYAPDNCLLSINPANSREIVASFVYNNADQVMENFHQAKKAQYYWGTELQWYKRVQVMTDFQREVEKNLHRLTAAVILETGKSRTEAFAEVQEFIDLMKYYLEIYSSRRGYTLPMMLEDEKHTSSNVVYKPFGVFVAITPFNFPVAMAGMCFGALLTGNTVVWKPAPETPLTGYLLHACFPPVKNVFNFVVAEEELFGNVIFSDPELVDGVAFTGSTEVGKMLGKKIASQNRRGGVRRFVAEMGGNNPCVITPSANMVNAGMGNARSAFGACAQKCSAEGRAIVHQSKVDEFIDFVMIAAEQMFTQGDPRYSEVTFGPVIHKRAFEAYHQYLNDAMDARAEIIWPRAGTSGLGQHGTLSKDGYFVEPIIINNLPPDHYLFHKELFAPILRIQPYEGGIEEAVRLANDTEYGLTAGIYTQDEQEKKYFFDYIQAGVTYANRVGGATTGAWPGNQAFGGWKNSGWGTQHGVCGPNYLWNFVRGQSQYDATVRTL